MMSNVGGGDDDISLEHLVRPLGPKPDDIDDLVGMDGPEN